MAANPSAGRDETRFSQIVRVAVLFFALVLSWAAAAQTAPARLQPPAEFSRDTVTEGLGSWIWDQNTSERQTCLFWRAFEIPPFTKVREALLRMTSDNEFAVYLDGREIGRGAEWREIYIFDLKPLLGPGRHVLAVKGYNSSWFGGMIAGLDIALSNGRHIDVRSDSSWRIAPTNQHGWNKVLEAPADWPAATVIAPFMGDPWARQPENVNIMPTLQPITEQFWQKGWFQLTLASVCGVVLVISLRLLAQVTLQRKEQWLLQRERARIARDIHDDLGSRMTQLVLHGEVAQSELPSDSETRSQIDVICQDAREALATVDEILWAVNPRRDTLRDFASYVCSYAEQYLKPTPILCLLDVDAEMPEFELKLPLRRSLLMSIKETLNNAVKHSNATELRLQIRWKGSHLVVLVKDNGKGFDPTRADASRNGLGNMKQRMAELGGSCVVSSKPGAGCTVEFVVPLKQSRWRLWKSIVDPRQWNSHLKETKPYSASETAQLHEHTGN